MSAPPEIALPVQAVGWLGNAFFFSRFLVQWGSSERAHRSVAPPLFWWLSLGGTAALGAYSSWKGAYVLLAGYVLNGAIYARNLHFQRGQARALAPRTAAAFAAAGAAFLVAGAVVEQIHRHEAMLAWVLVACLGQALWSSRFVVQWWASEREAESHFPASFWWLSLAGNVLLLAYTLHLDDPVLIAGYVPGPIVQIRNLMLGRAKAHEAT
jgi:lipid-A-disaccharide synthase-like uncharacterized protein